MFISKDLSVEEPYKELAQTCSKASPQPYRYTFGIEVLH